MVQSLLSFEQGWSSVSTTPQGVDVTMGTRVRSLGKHRESLKVVKVGVGRKVTELAEGL